MKTTSCPICDEPMPGDAAAWPQFPFCSKRCRTIDLGRWLGKGGYGIDKEPPDDESGDEDRDS